MRTIAIVNQKGGCGKTTTAINLASLYAKRGLRTLLVDMDPQSHCAAGLGVPESRIEYSIGDALIADHNASFKPASLVWEVARHLHLAPSTVMLSALEAPGGGLHQLADKDRRLESLLTHMAGQYDRCLIDCPPTIGLLTFNALRACREALIPVETGFFSLRGAEKQWNTIHRMISHIGRPIACHLLATLHKPQSQLACNILAALRRQFAGQILPVVIHEHEALREAASFGQPVFEYAPESDAARDFNALADWLEEHRSSPTVEIEVIAQAGMGGSGAVDGGAEPTAPLDPPAYGNTRAAELARRVSVLSARASKSPVGGVQTQELVEPVTVATVAVTAPPPALELPSPTIEPAAAAAPSAIATAHDSPLIAEVVAEPEFQQTSRTLPDLSHIYGVRQTSQGALFVQPRSLGETVKVTGDFNLWSSNANPLRYDEQTGVFSAVIALPRGQHAYRLIVDGDWILDPHNPNVQLNSYGEPNSMIVVR